MPSCSPLVFSTSTGSIRVRPSVRGSMSVASRWVSVSRHIAYTSHASLRARCASSASPSASRIGRCSHPFCIVQGGCFHSVAGLFGATDASSVIRHVGLVDAAVAGGGDVGGLVGSNAGSVAGSYTTGIISGTGDRVGGLAGRNQSTGAIRTSYSTARVSGNASVGGLVGEHDGALTAGYATRPRVGVEPGGGAGGEEPVDGFDSRELRDGVRVGHQRCGRAGRHRHRDRQLLGHEHFRSGRWALPAGRRRRCSRRPATRASTRSGTWTWTATARSTIPGTSGRPRSIRRWRWT